MNNEEKKARIALVVEKLCLEEGLQNALTDEEVNSLCRRAFKQQADWFVDHRVRQVVEAEMKEQLVEFKPRLAAKFTDMLDNVKWTLRDEIRGIVQSIANKSAQEAIRKIVDEAVSKMKVGLNITFPTEETETKKAP